MNTQHVAVQPVHGHGELHDYHTAMGFYIGAVTLIVASALLVHLFLHGGGILWIMTIFGAVILIAIISSILPSILDKREQR